MTEWQPVETAPPWKIVDVWLEGNKTIGRQPDCWLDGDTWLYHHPKLGFLELETSGIKVTHWMPLPSPPNRETDS